MILRIGVAQDIDFDLETYQGQIIIWEVDSHLKSTCDTRS